MKDKIFPFLSLVVSCAYASEKPNLIVIQTDEHTINTLGCYRRLVGDINDSPWGKNVVQTPNIDRLAKEGAICTRYYASSPVSTPSRASFQTGLYPVSTGCPINDMPMNPNLITYAEMLKRDGYQTSYVGKWHLGGVPNIGRPYFEPGYNFGYMDRTYMFNDGHWKYFESVKQPNKIRSYWSGPVKPGFIHVTEYLTDRCLELLERDKNKPFYMMLSIPDPHSPDIASEEYLQKYINLDYEAPETMVTNDTDQRPRWVRGGQYNVNKDKFDKKALANYFAMVECVDDNVGRILDFLDKNNLTDNTIVVFTADHGDMLYEHSRVNKGLPYESSARIPFVIRYPEKIIPGKIVNTVYTCVDFAPTILGLMGVKQIPGLQEGINDAQAFTNKEKNVKQDRIVYTTASPFNDWTMATDGRYKLVLSCRETPWLFDLEVDPDEMKNFYNNPKYKEIADRMQKELIRQMKLYKEPALSIGLPYLYKSTDKVNYNPAKYKSKVQPNALLPMIHTIEKVCMRPLK